MRLHSDNTTLVESIDATETTLKKAQLDLETAFKDILSLKDVIRNKDVQIGS